MARGMANKNELRVTPILPAYASPVRLIRAGNKNTSISGRVVNILLSISPSISQASPLPRVIGTDDPDVREFFSLRTALRPCFCQSRLCSRRENSARSLFVRNFVSRCMDITMHRALVLPRASPITRSAIYGVYCESMFVTASISAYR